MAFLPSSFAFLAAPWSIIAVLWHCRYAHHRKIIPGGLQLSEEGLRFGECSGAIYQCCLCLADLIVQRLDILLIIFGRRIAVQGIAVISLGLPGLLCFLLVVVAELVFGVLIVS